LPIRLERLKLLLAELGFRPFVIERGRDASSRKKDIARISCEQIIDPDSNCCFGEGRAGTFSDGMKCAEAITSRAGN